jgi:hypothetical protein
MKKPRRVGVSGKRVRAGARLGCPTSAARVKRMLCAATGIGALSIAALLGAFAGPVVTAAMAAQVSVVNVALHQAAGRVVLCVTKDTILAATVDDGTTAASSAANEVAARPPAIVPIGSGRLAVVMGAADWTRDAAGKPTALDEQLPALVKKAATSAGKVDPLNPGANDIESIGITVLEFVRPFVEDIHYKLDLATDTPLVEILLAGFTPGYGPEIWDLRYRVQQKNLGGDYWSTQPMRPSYYQLYPPEKGQPKTFIEAQYPAKLKPLDLARAAQSDPAIGRIRSSSPDINNAVMQIVNGDSAKAATRPAEDFLRLAIPALAGERAKLAMAAVDEYGKFQWVLAPGNLPPAPAETSTPTFRPREVQTDRPSLGLPGK